MNKKYFIYIIAIGVVAYFVYTYINKKPAPEPTPTPAPTPAPTNDGTYPTWVNKDYAPNVSVWWNGMVYKSF